MDRIIKFRAWHKYEKIMCVIEVLTSEGAFLLGVDKGNDQILNEGKMIVKAPDDGRFCFSKEFHLMQYTGLKDKNGKEIYEGDILNHKTTFNNNLGDRRFAKFSERKVSYTNGCFCDEYTSIPIWDSIRTITSFKIEIWTDFEIIGNIYENPELL